MRMRWWALTLSLISGFEGVRQAAYLDPVGVPTVCFGHTQGVMLGDTKTLEECHDLLAEEAEYFADVRYELLLSTQATEEQMMRLVAALAALALLLGLFH